MRELCTHLSLSLPPSLPPSLSLPISPSLSLSLSPQIALGTVTSVEEAVQWLSYTYLYVRMRLNPLAYGIPNSFREVRLT